MNRDISETLYHYLYNSQVACDFTHYTGCSCAIDVFNKIIEELFNLNIIGRKYRIKGMI